MAMLEVVGIPPGAVAGDDHLHAWQRLPDAVGLFACRERGCACGTRCVLAVLGRWTWPYGCVMASWVWRSTGVLPIREAVPMTVNRKLYPPKTVWEAMRRERLEQVGFRCELCGLA